MAWYVVHVGRVPGVYSSWAMALEQVHKYPGNCYKKYNTEDEAMQAFFGANVLDPQDAPLLLPLEQPLLQPTVTEPPQVIQYNWSGIWIKVLIAIVIVALLGYLLFKML
jgi:hypothetical protein